jgi:hypothetical protein
MKRKALILIAFGLGGVALMGVLVSGSATAAAASADVPGDVAASQLLVADVPLTVPLFFEGFETWPLDEWLSHSDEPFGDWGQTSAYTYSSGYAAFHEYPPGEADSWLVTPLVTPTAVSELLFWQLVRFSHRYDKHSVWISTQRQDPRYGDFVQLAEITPTAELVWEEARLSLSGYAGQPIYIAFRYEGDQADEWYIDDVQVTAGLGVISDGSALRGETITLTASAASGRNASFAWSFGDGEFGSGEEVTHTYIDSGDYAIVVTATNSVSVLTDTVIISIKWPIYLPLLLKE